MKSFWHDRRGRLMTLTNFWWLLIWLFTGGVLIAFFSPKERIVINGRIKERWWIVSAMLLAFPYILWAGFRTDSYGDTYAYRSMFRAAPSNFSEIASYVQAATKDKGFSALMALIKCIFGNSEVIFFLLIAFIQILCIVYFYKKYSCNFWLSMFLFVATGDYVSWMHNGMRQFLAVTIVLVALDFFIRKKYVVLILLLLLASSIHASALLMIPGIFIIQGKAWNKRSVLVLLAAMCAILMIDRFTNIMETLLVDTQYSDAFAEMKMMGDDGTNPIRVLVYSVPTILSIIGIKWIRKADDPVINMAVNAGICASGIFCISIFSSGILVGRLPVYFYMISQGILLPWLVENLFTKNSTKIVMALVIICYVAYFYYQMHFSMGLL